MLKIRLTRRGKKNKAFFRLVVAEHASPIKGKFIEALGFLNPHTKEKSLKNERIKYWMEKGAQCSDSAHNMLVKEGILKGPKRAVKMKKKEEVKEEVKSEEKAAPEKKEEAKTEEKSVPEKEEKAEEPKTETPKEEKKAEQKEEKEPEKKKEEVDPKGAEKEIVADEKK